MNFRMSPWLAFLAVLSAFLTVSFSAAQSVPCAAATRNPQVLDRLLNSHSTAADSDSAKIITISGLQHLRFNPITIQPGDAIYVEYRGEPFDLTAHLANGDVIGFDSASRAQPDQWRRGIYPLDMFGRGLDQKLIQLTATAKNPAHVLLRNITIVRAGKPVFEFAQLTSYGRPQVKMATKRNLPCKGNDEYPNRGTAFTEANRSAPSSKPTTPLTLTAQEIDRLVLEDTPALLPGDFMVFEANRRDFVFHILLSNGKEIVSQPLTKEDAEDTSVAWRQGKIPLDYPDALNQRIVRQRVVLLHESGPPLLLRGMKIDGKRRLIYELEKSLPGEPKTQPVEPPMSYPPDPHVMIASASKPNIWGHQPETGFLAPKLPSFPMRPMLFQSTTTTSTGDPNHFKFIGAELDSETGLYHMGRRYYSPALGRFLQPDPIYIEAHRLADPQQLNLYGYARNNPTTLSDPTGLDVKLNCDNAQNCNKAVQNFNSRKGAQFKVELGKDGKLHAVKGSVGKDLSKAESALLGAVNDTKSTAIINISGNTGQSEFGVHNGPGENSVDLGNLGQLDKSSNAGGLNSGDVLAHEALDAYYSLSMGEEAADKAAAGLFPGLFGPTQNQNFLNSSKTSVTDSTYLQGISDGRGGERVSIHFITPIPAIDVDPRFNSQERRNDAAHDAGSRVTGVTFEPKQ